MFVMRFLMPMGEVFVCSQNKEALLEYDRNIASVNVPDDQRINGNRELAITPMEIEFKPSFAGTKPARVRPTHFKEQ